MKRKPRKKDPIVHDPNQKLYDCIPTAFVRFHFGDNDFSWALNHAVEIVVERMLEPSIYWEKNYFAGKEHLIRRVFIEAMKAMVHLQISIRENGYREDTLQDSCEDAKVEFIDDCTYYQEHMDSGGDSVYLDCYSGILF